MLMKVYDVHFFMVLLAIGLLLCGCDREAPKDLGDGYTFFTTNVSNHYINKERKAIVDTNVVEYKVVNDFIVGLREPTTFFEVREELISKKYGYFILNKTTGELKEGLDKTELEEFIEELGSE